MGTLMDYKHYKGILGYLKVITRDNEEYNEIFERLKKIEFDTNGDTYERLKFTACALLMEYYTEKTDELNKMLKSKEIDKVNKEKINKEVKDTNKRLSNLLYLVEEEYTEYYDEAMRKKYLKSYQIDLFDYSVVLGHLMVLNIDGGYPHQVLVFCYRYLIDMEKPAGEVEDTGIMKLQWTPSDIVEKLFDKLLNELCRRFIKEYVEQSGLPRLIVDICFKPLKMSLGNSLKDIIAKSDAATRNLLKEVLETAAGDTKLIMYCPNNPEKNVTNWCSKVKDRIMDNMIGAVCDNVKEIKRS